MAEAAMVRAVAAVLLVLLVGCSDGDGEEAVEITPTTVESNTTSSASGRSEPGTLRVEDTTTSVGSITTTRHAELLSAAPTDGTGVLLTVTFLRAPEPCESHSRTTATESGNEIALLVVVTNVMQPDGKQCPDLLVADTTMVQIDRPLDARQVFDPNTGEVVPRLAQGF